MSRDVMALDPAYASFDCACKALNSTAWTLMELPLGSMEQLV